MGVAAGKVMDHDAGLALGKRTALAQGDGTQAILVTLFPAPHHRAPGEVDVLRADVSTGLIAGEDKNFAIEWAKNQVKNIVKNAIEVGSKSNIEIWAVDSVLIEKNLDADFIFFFTNPEGDYRKFNFTIKVN